MSDLFTECGSISVSMAWDRNCIIAISSELPEILAISDRIVVMREGRMTCEVNGNDANEELLMGMMALKAKAA